LSRGKKPQCGEQPGQGGEPPKETNRKKRPLFQQTQSRKPRVRGPKNGGARVPREKTKKPRVQASTANQNGHEIHFHASTQQIPKVGPQHKRRGPAKTANSTQRGAESLSDKTGGRHSNPEQKTTQQTHMGGPCTNTPTRRCRHLTARGKHGAMCEPKEGGFKKNSGQRTWKLWGQKTEC